MKFENDRAKHQARVAHRERMKRLDKAQSRANKAYDERSPERTKGRKVHEKRIKELEAETAHAVEAEEDRFWDEEIKRFNERPPLYHEREYKDFTGRPIMFCSMILGVVGLLVTATYYAWIAMAWYEAPAYMALGWGLEKLMQKIKKIRRK